MIGKLVLGFWILGWISLYGDLAVAQRWPTPLEESLDEMHDAEIFRAVVESMRQWSMQKKLHSRSKREVSKVCYEDVGCFEDTGPFSYLEMLPSPPKDVGTRFLVYGSRKARSIPMEVPADDIDDEAHRAIDPDLPTKVIVHGFGSSCDYVWVYEMRSALMAVHECNIVCVDWGPGSAVPNYVRAAANTRLVGRQLAKLVRSLKVPLEKIHLIGFSLGAHVAGFAGAELGNVSRITGLDPAGPLFESQDPRARLDETDANFVDVIHSNGEQLILGGLGSSQPMGDVDFYPNGGRMQTGCSNLFVGAVSDIIWSSAVEGRSLCNHRRAYKLFTDSVSPKCRFPAFPCSRGYDGLLRGDCFPCGSNDLDRPCGDMGYYSDESPARGQLYLVTRDEEPFCAHQYQVKVYNSRSERPARSYGKLQVTLVGEDSFNDTFAMTRKDEELLVGAILQKIIVPHPAVSNLEALEIKYTAYSGWISSGLVSWSIDKVAVVDSFGKTLSVCKKGLSLESGRAIYLPLFPGECNIPVESDNSSSSTFERLVKEKPGGIGPFTKEHNYETKDFSSEGFSREKTSPSRGLGPFTKEQNLRSSEPRDTLEDSSGRRGSLASSWNVIDVSGDAGDSNSLENADAESGRGFSGSNLVAQEPPVDTSSDASTEFLPEIREPVLRVGKKETVGRSLKLTEITEPILRPRPTRQNGNGEVVVTDAAGCQFAGDCRGSRNEEPQEASPSTTRSFTVQFLPERLAGILAQAEKYARQTLLPLISQYTPSFVGGGRRDEPKYFPPLGDIVGEESTEEATSIEISSRIDETEKEDSSGQSSGESSTIAEEIHRENSSGGSTEKEVLERSNEWVPVGISSRRDLEASRSLAWETGNYTWHEESTRNTENTTVKMEFDDWVPITIESEDRETSTSALEESTPSTSTEKEANVTETTVTNSSEEGKDERKYIPLIDPDGDKPPTTSTNDIPESSSASSFTHIQKIPRSKETDVSTRRTMVFPYAYERNKDPRTRYIPLIPEEDLERPRRFFSERER